MHWPLTLILIFTLQTGEAVRPESSIFTPKEMSKLDREKNVEDRIKVYESASKRIQEELDSAVSKNNFETVPETLKTWTSLLSRSLDDIEANLNKKKKSRPLIRYEIQVRKSIANTRNYKMGAPLEQHDLFDACLEEAERIRQKFVQILFPH